MIKVSAPGKIHLIGEHSAVYGKSAILAAIDLRFYAEISATEKKEILGIVQYDNAIKNFQKNLEELISKKYNIKIPPYKIEFKNELPLGSGLGSSAAFSAIFTASLLKFLKIKFNTKTLNELAFEGEKIFNGNPSGGDNTTVIYGGLIWYRKETEFLKTFTPLPQTNINKFLLIDSGKPEERTSEMVKLVASLREVKRRGSILLENFLSSQETLAKQMSISLIENNQKLFMQTILESQNNLEKLGVVGKKAKTIIKEIELLNGAAKITGAGGIKKGSGMILAYHKNLNGLIKFAKENNLKYYSVEISNKGITY